MYDEIKVKKRSGEKTKKQKKKIAKAIMYEADDYDDQGRNALDIGLGDAFASTRASRRNLEISMPLGQRLGMKKSEDEMKGEATQVRIKGEGVSREVSYVPKDARKKMEEAKKRRDQGEEDDVSHRRKRRGIKELGFKTPFRNNR